MNSINEQQPENNKKNLAGEEAIKKIKDLVDAAKTCFFCTDIKEGKPFATRPMSVQKVDEEGNIWFLSANDSHINMQLEMDDAAQLLFQGSSYAEFLSLYGSTIISEDKEKIKDLWEPILKDWFNQGIDDPRISVIKFEISDGYYWDNKHGMAISLFKKVAGAITGKTLDDSIEGKIQL